MRFRGLVNVVAQNATAGARRASIAGLIGALLGSGSAGCSLLFSEAAPAGHETRAFFACGESPAPPILDTVAVGLFGATLLQGQSSSMSESDRDATLAVTIGAAVLAAGSAVYGYTAVADCRAARRARAMEIARASWLPPPYGLPPYGASPSLWPPVSPPAAAAHPP